MWSLIILLERWFSHAVGIVPIWNPSNLGAIWIQAINLHNGSPFFLFILLVPRQTGMYLWQLPGVLFVFIVYDFYFCHSTKDSWLLIFIHGSLSKLNCKFLTSKMGLFNTYTLGHTWTDATESSKYWPKNSA